MYEAHCARAVDVVFAHIGGSLDLSGATLAELNLSGASIIGDLMLSEPGKPAVWKGMNGEPGALTLRNTHIGNLMDAKDAWPVQGHLKLDGFSFNHLGGFVRLDPNYTPAPYMQLAAALTASGDRDAANEIRYLGRVRERETETDWPTFSRDSFNGSPVSVSAPTHSEFFIGSSASHSLARSI